MGGRIVLPEADASITKVIKNFHFTPNDISDFWKYFQRMDKAKTGLVSLNIIFKKIGTERNLLTDVLLELLEIEHDGEINFSDFLLMITTYCFFETIDILKFCFYVFDQDKTGFFSVDDLNNLINAVHDVKPGSTVRGTVKASWNMLTFKADEMEFHEFRKIHDQFPRLFQPAFRLQQLMILKYKGESWWNKKKQKIIDLKHEADMKIEAKKKKKQKKKDAKKNRKIQRNMGVIRYYLCPCWRKFYDPSLTAYDKMTEEEKRERDKQVALARRQAELKVKNPETAAWLKYQRKVADKTYVIETIEEDAEGPMDIYGPAAVERLDASSLLSTALGTSGKTNAASNNTGADGGGTTPRSSINSISGPDTARANNGNNRQSITSQTSDVTSQHSGTPRIGDEAKPATVSPGGYSQTDSPSSLDGDMRPRRVKKVVVNNYLDQKLGSTERNRQDRADSRAMRKKARQKDPELRQKY